VYIEWAHKDADNEFLLMDVLSNNVRDMYMLLRFHTDNRFIRGHTLYIDDRAIGKANDIFSSGNISWWISEKPEITPEKIAEREGRDDYDEK
jgi:hypothetical protein